MPITHYKFRVWRGGFRIVCRGPKSGLRRLDARIPALSTTPIFPRKLVAGLDNLALLAEAIESGGSASFSRRFDEAICQWRRLEK